MRPISFDLHEALVLLERTPATLTAWLTGLPDRWISCTEGEGTWSAYDVIGHLIHGERTDWIPRARHILAGRIEPFVAFDRNAQFADSPKREVTGLLKQFAELRSENLSVLRAMNLQPEDLQRRGIHPELGSVTLAELLATWVAHDLDHLGQIARTMAKAYTDAVGPWQQYLSILHDRED